MELDELACLPSYLALSLSYVYVCMYQQAMEVRT
jgi:hypothetical protein